MKNKGFGGSDSRGSIFAGCPWCWKQSSPVVLAFDNGGQKIEMWVTVPPPPQRSPVARWIGHLLTVDCYGENEAVGLAACPAGSCPSFITLFSSLSPLPRSFLATRPFHKTSPLCISHSQTTLCPAWQSQSGSTMHTPLRPPCQGLLIKPSSEAMNGSQYAGEVKVHWLGVRAVSDPISCPSTDVILVRQVRGKRKKKAASATCFICDPTHRIVSYFLKSVNTFLIKVLK